MRLKLTRYLSLGLIAFAGGCGAMTSASRGGAWMETDLYCGMSRNDGSIITDPQFNRFINDVVTPRFPDGLTILPANGQYRNSDGQITHEPTRVIVILYRAAAADPSRAALQRIAQQYCTQFGQESVLEVDRPARVNFVSAP
jgi:hypothetical protein